MTVSSTTPDQNGRLHACDDCGWVGTGEEAPCVVKAGRPTFECPECGGDTHREYFGNPLPAEGTRLKTPVGLDECPVCGTPGIFVSDEAHTCLCGAELAGLSTTEIVTVPERGEKDVIIRASEDDLHHKVFDYMDVADNEVSPRRSLAYWSVNGTPQKTGPGRTIMFSTDGETVDYHAPICTAEEGRIWFAFLSPTKYEVPVEPPTRGFRYLEWGDYPW